MSEGYGAYNPPAAGYEHYDMEMAAWRNLARAESGYVSGYADAVSAGDALAETSGTEGVAGSIPASTAPADADPLDEHDEDPQRVAEAFEEGEKGVTAPVPLEGPDEDLTGAQALQVYDPAENHWRAVVAYLNKAPRPEVIRVLEAEKRGKARQGILKLEADLLAHASDV